MTQLSGTKSAKQQRVDYPDVEEQRGASLPARDNDPVGGIDDKTVVVLSTEELTPVPDVSPSTIDAVVEALASKADWLELYEAVLVLRRVVVHHAAVVSTQQVESFLRPLALECDSLRSAPSKNGLLACAECFQFLPRSMLERSLFGGAHPEVLDVLLRRSACEKKFLRDAAAIATSQLAQHLAGLPLLVACARYGTNKNGKLCSTAAGIMALSLSRFQDAGQLGGKGLTAVYKALTAFRDSKDASARSEATSSFRSLATLLGMKELEHGLKEAFPGASQPSVVAKILKDATPKASSSNTKTQPSRTGSLRARMKQTQH